MPSYSANEVKNPNKCAATSKDQTCVLCITQAAELRWIIYPQQRQVGLAVNVIVIIVLLRWFIALVRREDCSLFLGGGVLSWASGCNLSIILNLIILLLHLTPSRRCRIDLPSQRPPAAAATAAAVSSSSKPGDGPFTFNFNRGIFPKSTNLLQTYGQPATK